MSTDFKITGHPQPGHTASIAGSGDISVYCKGGTLKATVAGSGDIVYSGKPDKVLLFFLPVRVHASFSMFVALDVPG